MEDNPLTLSIHTSLQFLKWYTKCCLQQYTFLEKAFPRCKIKVQCACCWCNMHFQNVPEIYQSEHYTSRHFKTYQLDIQTTKIPHHSLMLHINNSLTLHAIKKHPGTHNETMDIIVNTSNIHSNIAGLYWCPTRSIVQLLTLIETILKHKSNLPQLSSNISI